MVKIVEFTPLILWLKENFETDFIMYKALFWVA